MSPLPDISCEFPWAEILRTGIGLHSRFEQVGELRTLGQPALLTGRKFGPALIAPSQRLTAARGPMQSAPISPWRFPLFERLGDRAKLAVVEGILGNRGVVIHVSISGN